MPGLARTDERRWALGVLNTALGGGMSSRLFQEVREKRGLAYSVYSYTSGFADCGLFGVYAGCRPSQVHDVLKICRDELDQVADRRPVRRRDRPRHRPALRLHRPRPGGHRRADEPHRQERAVLGRADVGRRHAGPDRRVTPDDVRAVAREVLGQRPSLSVIGPLKDKQAARLHEAVS